MEFTQNGECVIDPSWHPAGLNAYGVTSNVSDDEKGHIKAVVKDVAFAVWGVVGFNSYTSLWAAFKAAFPFGLIFQDSQEKSDKGWGETVGNSITIYTNAKVNDPNFNHFLVHEMGHAFDNAVGGELTSGYDARLQLVKDQNWTSMPTGNEGYASSDFPSPWIQGHHEDGTMEETADMFLGWVYGTWGKDRRRGNWMDLWMPSLLNGAAPGYLSQYNCNEDTGKGCY
jgi:hypothetical protein